MAVVSMTRSLPAALLVLAVVVPLPLLGIDDPLAICLSSLEVGGST
jgi:hypothetical protein